MKYGTWTFGQVEALLNRLGEDNALKLLGCREVNVTFDIGDNLATVTADAPALKAWKTIKLGTGIKTGSDFCTALEQADFRIGDYARDMLKQEAFTAAAEPVEVDLVLMSVKDLGFEGNTRYDQICARAKELGLELCPAEVGPQLRLQYPEQPRGEWFLIAMEAIRALGGGLLVFSVGHSDDGGWLGGHYGGPDGVWLPDYQFVFVSRK